MSKYYNDATNKNKAVCTHDKYSRSNGFTKLIRRISGHSPRTDNLKTFAPLTRATSASGLCTWTTPPTCVATPVGELQWRLHGRHSYYVTLKLEGVNGLERVVSSDEYEHYIGPPSGGVVVEIPVTAAYVVNMLTFIIITE